MNASSPTPSESQDPEEAADAIIDDLNQDEPLPPEESDVIADTEPPEPTELIREESWSGLGADLGHRASKTPLEDDFTANEELVEAGLDEADDELRDLGDENIDDATN